MQLRWQTVGTGLALSLASLTASAQAAMAQAARAPAVAATPSAAASATPAVAPAPKAVPNPLPAPSPAATGSPVVQPTPTVPPPPKPDPAPVMVWTVADAQALLGIIADIESEGLIPADYQPDALRAAIAGSDPGALNAAASKSFAWLVEDLRDGRTPVKDRLQWFALDPDQDAMPTAMLMAKALESHDLAGVLAGLEPSHHDYAALKAALAATPKTDLRTRNRIRANMDRWRWLTRDLGTLYLITNVPEYQLRLTVRNEIIRTYRTVVGKPGKTATPQLAERVEAVVFNPTWTVPQSIVMGEGLGPRLIRDPAAALRQGYKVSRGKDGFITVVQQPGPNNSLGLMKIDMPNPHAIYLHDTPARGLFNAPARAFSHGCIRTERATELGMTMAILGSGMTPQQGVEYATSGKYTKVPMTKTFPVYITYFTMGQDINGRLSSYNDIYGRDAPVLASFAAPRQLKTSQRISNEAVIKLDNPL